TLPRQGGGNCGAPRRHLRQSPLHGAGLRPAGIQVALGLLWLLLALGASGFGPPTLGTGDPFGAVVGSNELQALGQAPAVPTTVRSLSAIVVDGDSGHALASRGADTRMA